MSLARTFRAPGEAGNVQAELKAEIRRNASPFAGGVIVKGVELPAGTSTDVSHTLGRAPQGWVVVRDYGATAHNIREVDPPTSPGKRLTFNSTTACKVDILFF